MPPKRFLFGPGPTQVEPSVYQAMTQPLVGYLDPYFFEVAADVRRLLIAGLYHQARIARDSSRFEESARLTEELTRQAPDDPHVKLLGAESLLRDRKDPNAALAAIAAIPVPPDSRFFAVEKDLLASEALAAAGQKDSARALLNALAQKFPNSRWIKDAIAKVQ